MKVGLIIPCSFEQAEVIADHFFENKELGLLPDERDWMLFQARQKYPTCKIVSADLCVSDAEWDLTLEVPETE